MSNSYFQFKQFVVQQDKCAMKVTTDACLFGAWAAAEMKSRKNEKQTCLDIGAGTGLLSLMVSQKNMALKIDAIEIDKEAAFQAADNVESSSFKHNIKIIHEDVKVFSPLHSYNIIVSNPPFYENDLAAVSESKNKAHHSSGLLIAEWMDSVKKLLSPEGIFYLLMPAKREDELEQLFKEKGFFIYKKVAVKQTPEHASFRIFYAGSLVKTKQPLQEETIIIKAAQNEYSAPFIEYLQPYYLYL